MRGLAEQAADALVSDWELSAEAQKLASGWLNAQTVYGVEWLDIYRVRHYPMRGLWHQARCHLQG